MSVVAAAVIGSAVVGGVMSDKASKRAAQTADKGTDAQLALGRETNDMTERMAEQARADVNRLFGQQETNTRAGLQAGMNLFNQTIPAQFEQARAGNVGAQRILSGALPQMNNAILGNAIDYSAFQPTELPAIDTNMFNVQLPDYIPVTGAPQPEPDPVIPQIPYRGVPRGLPGNNQFGGRVMDRFGQNNLFNRRAFQPDFKRIM